MPRIARIVVPGLPHHVTQRGNNRQDVFVAEELTYVHNGRRFRLTDVAGNVIEPILA